MAQSGRRTIKIEAPIMLTSDKIAVWMDQGEWCRDFFAWLSKNKLNNKLSGLQHKQRKLKLTKHEIVTLASIIEGEAIYDSERAKISAVYHNRLNIGMRLQADPTIQYIIPDSPRSCLLYTSDAADE